MHQQARHQLVMREAAEALGGGKVLSSFLGVTATQLERWLSGSEPVPLETFMTALDLIADGPFVNRRTVRVAAIKTQNK